MKFLITITLMLLIYNNVHAQNPEYNLMASSMQIMEKESDEKLGVSGSPYIEEDFTKGQVVERDGKAQNVYLRYNTLQDQVEVKVTPNDPETFILPKSPKYSYRLNDYSYKLLQFRTDGGDFVSGYVISYFEGENYALVAKPKVKSIAGRKASSGFGADRPDRIKIEYNYYLGSGKDSWKELDLKEKSFKNILPASKESNTYFSDNKLKSSKDFTRLLEWYENQKKTK